MPKLSVYVPDELWSEATRAEPERGTSEVVQEALNSWLASNRATDLALAVERSPLKGDRVDRIRARLFVEARAEYENGYEAGIALAETLHWRPLDLILRLSGGLENRLKKAAELDELALDPWRGSLGDFLRQEIQSRTWERGAIQALRDVWEWVMGAEPVLTGASKETRNRIRQLGREIERLRGRISELPLAHGDPKKESARRSELEAELTIAQRQLAATIDTAHEEA